MLTMETEGICAAASRVFKNTLLVYHGNKTVELVPVSTATALDAEDSGTMRRALADLDVRDIFKVKIDDGTFFGGKDLCTWLCERLREEVAFGAAVRKELEDEREAASKELDRLAETEKDLKSKLKEASTDLMITERRLTDTTEALRLQKDMRLKDTLQQQATSKETDSLKSEVSRLTERINMQADVSTALEKQCEALKSAVRVGRQRLNEDDAEEQRHLAQTLTREEDMARLKRRVYSAEKAKVESSARASHCQRESERLRALLWSNGINPTEIDCKIAGKRGARRRAANRGTNQQEQQRRQLAPLQSFSSNSVMTNHESWRKPHGNVVGHPRFNRRKTSRGENSAESGIGRSRNGPSEAAENISAVSSNSSVSCKNASEDCKISSNVQTSFHGPRWKANGADSWNRAIKIPIHSDVGIPVSGLNEERLRDICNDIRRSGFHSSKPPAHELTNSMPHGSSKPGGSNLIYKSNEEDLLGLGDDALSEEVVARYSGSLTVGRRMSAY